MLAAWRGRSGEQLKPEPGSGHQHCDGKGKDYVESEQQFNRSPLKRLLMTRSPAVSHHTQVAPMIGVIPPMKLKAPFAASQDGSSSRDR